MAGAYGKARKEVLGRSPVRCPICGSPPSEVQEVEMPSADRFRRYDRVFTCPNVDRDDHRATVRDK